MIKFSRAKSPEDGLDIDTGSRIVASGNRRISDPDRAPRIGVRERVNAMLRLVVRVEAGYVLLLVSAFVLPQWTNAARIPALVLAVTFAAGHAVLARRRPAIPVAMVAYLAAYALASVHSDPAIFSITAAGKILAPPVFALAVAWVAQEASIRRSVVLLSIAAVALQVPVVLYQTADLLIGTERALAMMGADSITGLLGDSQASALGQAGLLAGMVVLAAGFTGAIGPRSAFIGGAILIFLSVPTSTRVSYLLVPLALGAIAVAIWIGRREAIMPPRLGAQAAAALAVLSAPVLFLSTAAVYPGANDPLLSWAGLTAALEQGDRQLDEEIGARQGSAGRRGSGGAGSKGTRLSGQPGRQGSAGRGGPGGAGSKGTRLSGQPGRQGSAGRGGPGRSGFKSTRLPGRQLQITTGFELSVGAGPVAAILGRGIGASDLGDPTNPVIRPEQNTNGVWLARTVVETGYLGVLAFVVLIGYLLALWWRNRALLDSPGWDAAVIYALPGIAVLTFVSAFYNPILVLRPYVIFWALLGVAIAIDASRRKALPVEGADR